MKTTKLLFGILTITAALAVQVQAQSFLTNGLVAYYPFNGNANDLSGNGNNGTVNGNTLTTNRFGMASSAYSFSGANWITVPYNSDLFNQTQTISIWLNTANYSNVGALRSGYTVADSWHGYFLGSFNFNSEFGFQDYTGSGYAAQVGLAQAAWPVNKWFQIVFVRTTTTAQLFKNGTLVAQATNLPPSVPALDSGLFIGSNADGNGVPNSFFTGAIDDIRIYNRALSSNEVAQLYAIESPPIINIQKAVYLTSNNLWTGSNYQVQASSDLINWTNQGSAFTATTNVWRSTNYWDVANWNQLFFRLQLSP